MLDKIAYFKDKPKLAEALDLVIVCVITLIVGLLLNHFIILVGFVPSGSMENLIMINDQILANRTAYWNEEPQRGDIVVFYAPDEKAAGNTVHYVKRIIGLPGETVTIDQGLIYIDGKLLDESAYLEFPTRSGDGEYKVPEGHYFMLGDHRTDSADSRVWRNKYVPLEDIQGKVFLKYSLRLKNLHASWISSYNDYNI